MIEVTLNDGYKIRAESDDSTVMEIFDPKGSKKWLPFESRYSFSIHVEMREKAGNGVVKREIV